jgi:hypothetical protein
MWSAGACVYIGFIVTVFVIPDHIAFGESLCFAYTYNMMQVMQLRHFKHNKYALITGVVFAFAAPTTQIFLVMVGGYNASLDKVFGELYMCKEIILYMFMRVYCCGCSDELVRRTGKVDTLVCALVGTWVLFDSNFWIHEEMDLKLMRIIHFTPVFFMALLGV